MTAFLDSLSFIIEVKSFLDNKFYNENNFKKCLITNISYGNSKKVRNERYKECGKLIISYLYKKAGENDENL